MKTYNTYQEAKIANPGSEIFTDGNIFAIARLAKPLSLMKRCHPKDYCMTLEEFLADGYKLVSGDAWLSYDGEAIEAAEANIFDSNTPDKDDYKRYILKAKALEDEFNSSKTPSDSEWDGTGLPPVGVECEFTPHNTYWGFHLIKAFKGVVLHYEGEQFVFMLSHEKYKLEGGMLVVSLTDKGDFGKPETPGEREEREHLEVAKDLWEKIKDEDDIDWDSISIWLQDHILSLVKVMGYRNGTKS